MSVRIEFGSKQNETFESRNEKKNLHKNINAVELNM